MATNAGISTLLITCSLLITLIIFFFPAFPSYRLMPSFFCIFDRKHKFLLVSYFSWHYLHTVVLLLVHLFQWNRCYCCLFFVFTDSCQLFLAGNYYRYVTGYVFSFSNVVFFKEFCITKSLFVDFTGSYNRPPGLCFTACVLEISTGSFLAFSAKPGDWDKGIKIIT